MHFVVFLALHLLSLSKIVTFAIGTPWTDTPGDLVVKTTWNDSLDFSKTSSFMIWMGMVSVSEEWLSVCVIEVVLM